MQSLKMITQTYKIKNIHRKQLIANHILHVLASATPSCEQRTRLAGCSPSAGTGSVWEPGSHLFCFFHGHTPFSGFALKNKGVPIMLSYFKTTGSRLLPAGPKRGHYTRQEPPPRRPRQLTPERTRPRALCQHQAQPPAALARLSTSPASLLLPSGQL